LRDVEPLVRSLLAIRAALTGPGAAGEGADEVRPGARDLGPSGSATTGKGGKGDGT